MRPTCGHVPEEDGVELDDGAQHLLDLLRGEVALAVTLQHQLVVLLLEEHQHVPEQHTLHLWETGRDGGDIVPDSVTPFIFAHLHCSGSP